MDDERWMRAALDLAMHGRGRVEPNPMVGAIVVREGTNVGEGWHDRFGGPHAEINALAKAGEAARGATLYVTLEPCCHTGKTPACTDEVIRSGVRRVIAAMADPFPQVAGGGVSQLRAAGVEVAVGVCESNARRLNRPYLTLVEKGRPYVHVKWAMSLDGRIATRTGESKWISNEESRRRVHELRGRMDAIIVGAGTVRADDPLLTARPAGPRAPARVVLSSRPVLPSGCRLLRTAADAPVIVAAAEPGSVPGAEVLVVPSVVALLAELGRRRMTNVLVEGGTGVFGSFLDADLIDEVHAFVAPTLIGHGVPVMGGMGAQRIKEALRFAEWTVERLDGDVYVHGIV